MITFIKNYSLDNIKYKLLILYILNVTDIIFTLLLLNTGLYIEANTLMTGAVQNPMAGFTLKVVLPAAMLFYLYIRMQKANNTQLKISNVIINIAAFLYALINTSHLIWFILLIQR